MIITSFSQKGYHEYGKRFIESFLEHWKDEKLTVFYEKGIPSNAPKDERITYINLYDYDDFVKFEELMKQSDPLFSGIHLAPNGETVYNFRFDANRFYRKVYCIAHSCRTDEDKKPKRVAWVDADVYFQKDVPLNYLNTLLPDEKYIAHLGREWMYTESGFVIFNTAHDANNVFMPLYYNSYFTGAFRYLGEFHDCYVLDYLIKVLAIPVVNLTVNEISDHVFTESDMGKYMVHLKGPQRKEQGKPLSTDPVREAL